MPSYYRIYGLTLRVPQPLPVARLVPADTLTDASPVDVHLLGQTGRERLARLRVVSASESVWRTWSSTQVEEAMDGEVPYLWIHFSRGIEFLVDRAGTEVWGWWPESVSFDDAASYFVGPVIGTVLRLRGTTVLHACAVGVDGRAIAMLGDAGAGKSSLAAAFARRGFPILTDDLSAVVECDGTLWVQPGHRWLFVPEASVAALFGAPDALPQAVPPWPKRRLDLTTDGYRLQTTPLPLSAVYLIGTRSQSPRAPFVRRVSGRRALIALLINAHSSRRVQIGMPEKDFDVLGRIAATLPVRRVNPMVDPACLPELCETILSDFDRVTAIR